MKVDDLILMRVLSLSCLFQQLKFVVENSNYSIGGVVIEELDRFGSTVLKSFQYLAILPFFIPWHYYWEEVLGHFSVSSITNGN